MNELGLLGDLRSFLWGAKRRPLLLPAKSPSLLVFFFFVCLFPRQIIFASAAPSRDGHMTHVVRVRMLAGGMEAGIYLAMTQF